MQDALEHMALLNPTMLSVVAVLGSSNLNLQY